MRFPLGILRKITGIALALLFAAFAWWVWPTPWEHYVINQGDLEGTYEDYRSDPSTTVSYPLAGSDMVVRVHRVTGYTEALDYTQGTRWFDLAEYRRKERAEEKAEAEAAAKKAAEFSRRYEDAEAARVRKDLHEAWDRVQRNRAQHSATPQKDSRPNPF